MINDQFTPEDQTLIQQIQSTPHLEIGAAARDAIRQRMLSEFRVVNQQTAARAAQVRLVVLAVTAAVIITAAVVIAVVISRGGSQNTEAGVTTTPISLSASPQATNTPTLIPTETSTPTVTETIPTSTQTQVEVSASATITPTLLSLSPLPETPVPTLGSAAIATQTPISAANTPTPEPVLASAMKTSTPLPITATPESDSLIVIEGPVINIVNNIITVYDFQIEVEANHPILNLIQIGDMVRIEGVYNSTGVVAATVVSNLSDMTLVNGATVSLDGPVESINGHIIVVNGISVQLADNDPMLQTVQVGQFVRVQGNFQGSGSTIVLVVVNIVVNVGTETGGGNTDSNGGNSNCYWKENGMSGMGRWHCDDKAMGMGMGD